MATASRRRDYLLRRPGSSNWLVRLRDGDGRRYLKSLGTPDRARAEVLAMDMIRDHKARVLAARPRLRKHWQSELEPGLHDGPDGERIAATERDLSFYDAGGKLLRTEPNGGEVWVIVGNGELRARDEFAAFDGAYAGTLREGVIVAQRPKVPTKGTDDDILESYIGAKELTGYYEREARSVWAVFRTLCDKPLKDCSRDEAGRALYKHYKAQGLKDASIRKKIMWLVAAVNYASENRKPGDPLKLAYNPFVNAVPEPKPGEKSDSVRRKSLDDDDIKNAKANLGKLDKSDQLLFRVLATTGMRLSEAFQIKEEETIAGHRCITIGTKTENSVRTIPLPADLLPHMPVKIKGALFTGRTNDASKRLNGFLRDIGITDRRKVLHCLRHRAKDQLREAECPDKLAEALFGREKGTRSNDSGDGYGEGYSRAQLKKWLDKIGF